MYYDMTLGPVKVAALKTVERDLIAMAASCFPRQKFDRVSHLLDHVDQLFAGKIAPYQKNDTAYHDFEHTLRVSYCWSQMFHSLHHHRKEIPVIYMDYLLGLAACLLHDCGYLKEQADIYGTGAKFTLIHETRSCMIARRFLMTLSWPESAIAVVQRIIAATGPRAVIDAIPFASPTEKHLGQMLATADFLAQMADPNYADKLPDLFAEFEEIDKLRGIEEQARPFPDLAALRQSTPNFWYQFVLPRLRRDYANAYQLLSSPYPDGPNAYLKQAERTICQLEKAGKDA